MSDDILARSFAAQLADLHQGMLASWHAEAPDAGLVEWAAFTSDTRPSVRLPELAITKIPAHRWAEAPILAAVGYRLAHPATSREAEGLWLDGARRLMARDAVPADRNSFFFRPVELLGLAAGSQAIAGRDETPQSWLRELLTVSGHLLPRTSVWPSVMHALAASRTGAGWQFASRFEPATATEIAVLLWLALIDENLAAAATPADRDTLTRRLLETAGMTQPQPQGLAERGILCIALQRSLAEALGGLKLGGATAASFVADLCPRFPLLTAELGNRHAGRPAFAITDEYDVQDLLRSILRLHFEDVRAEEWNPSYGGTQSRSDLLLKPERVVIETKMTRKSLGQRELVAAADRDKAQYQRHPDCSTLVCFVYDSGAVCVTPPRSSATSPATTAGSRPSSWSARKVPDAGFGTGHRVPDGWAVVDHVGSGSGQVLFNSGRVDTPDDDGMAERSA